jgi:3-hydroxyisobutyrate dehydrogenase-like beta-hydroxyacid dehydrogenase
VAFAGAGRMGAAMIGRLRGADGGARFDVHVYNRTAGRATAVAAATGAHAAPTARDAVAGAPVVLVSLADDAAVESVYAGPDGVLAGLAPGAVVVETSTVAPETVHRLARLVAGRGADLLDAPVSGSVPVVERGELTFLVGGDPATLDKVRPVLAPLARTVLHLGPIGAGATVKLAVNSVVHALNLALAEALVLAERAGVDRAAAYEAFASSAVAAPFVHYKKAAFLAPEQTPVAFRLDLVAKDLALIEALAAGSGARMDQLAATRATVQAAVAAGHGDSDMSAIAGYLRGHSR